MVKRLSVPQQLAQLIELMMEASPKVKHTILRILSHLQQLQVPAEVFEETIKLCCNNDQSPVSQILTKVKPAIKFTQSKYLAFLHQYALSIR